MYQSTLTQIAQQVFTATSLTQAKTMIQNHIGETRIKDADKTTILSNTNSIKSLTKLQSYLCNSLLKFEGLGTI